jgi:hypothetical protein
MPTETTPTIIRRYYPTLSSIINSDDIPEVLGFIKDGVQSLIDKIHYKDLQFNKIGETTRKDWLSGTIVSCGCGGGIPKKQK